jgi:hypothetical protein
MATPAVVSALSEAASEGADGSREEEGGECGGTQGIGARDVVDGIEGDDIGADGCGVEEFAHVAPDDLVGGEAVLCAVDAPDRVLRAPVCAGL